MTPKRQSIRRVESNGTKTGGTDSPKIGMHKEHCAPTPSNAPTPLRGHVHITQIHVYIYKYTYTYYTYRCTDTCRERERFG